MNYRSVFDLSLALKSLFYFESERSLFEVIVVNNDPGEEQALLALGEKLQIRVYCLKENIGFGKAVNVGVAQARGEVIGLLNPDTEWRQTILSEIRQLFRGKTEEQILGIRLLSATGKPEPFSFGKAPSLFSLLKHNLPFLWYREKTGVNPDWVSAAALFLSKPLFQRLKGFDEQFFLYFEDVDLCLRAMKQGAAIILSNRFALVHHGGKSFSSNYEQKRHYFASQRRYYEKHRPAWEYFLLRILQRAFMK